MAFSVIHLGGTNADFTAYARLLRQSRVDPGKIPHEADAETLRLSPYVWQDRSSAEQFAEELRRHTGDNAWEVTEVAPPPPEGPLGPGPIQVAAHRHGKCERTVE